MKRFLTSAVALLAMMIPASSFARDRDDDGYRSQPVYQNQQGYQQYSYGQSGYDPYVRDQYRDQYAARPAYRDDYNRNYYGGRYDYERNGYERNNWGRTTKYVGGGAAAGAVLGALVGQGPGAAIGALIGGTGGFLYKKHKDHDRYYGRGY